MTTAVDVLRPRARPLWAHLTGRPPVGGDSVFRDRLRRVREQRSRSGPRPSIRRSARDLETICLKCLEKDPRRAAASAEVLADDLGRWLAGLPIAARPATLPERAIKWAEACAGHRPLAPQRPGPSRSWQPSWPYAVPSRPRACARSIPLDPTRSDREEKAARLKAEAEVARRIERESRTESEQHFDRIAAAERVWAANDVPAADRILDDCPPGLRRWEWSAILKRLCHAEIRTIEGHSSMACGVRLRPATAAFCCPDQRGGVGIWDDPGNREVCRIPGHDGFAYGVAFDQAGKRAGDRGRRRQGPLLGGPLRPGSCGP